MTHYRMQEWQAYIQGGEVDRTSMDTHLLECDECSDIYLIAVEELNETLPQLTNKSTFSEDVWDQIRWLPNHSKTTHQPTSSKKWYMNTFFQYTIAASLTLLLVGSGTFEQMFDRVSQISLNSEKAQQTSVTNQLTNKAGQWLDAIPAKHVKKEGKR